MYGDEAGVEVGDKIEFPKPTDVLGRIAAQTAKQVIFQKVREAERDNVFSEYSGRVGEVVNGIIKRQEMGDFIVDLGRAEALLPRKEQSRAETYQAGDRTRVAIVRVLKAADVALDCSVTEEACPLNLVPTASTTGWKPCTPYLISRFFEASRSAIPISTHSPSASSGRSSSSSARPDARRLGSHRGGAGRTDGQAGAMSSLVPLSNGQKRQGTEVPHEQ